MHIIRNLADLPQEARGGAVAIGNFDGVHRGHVRIVERVLERAQEIGGPAVVFTFDPHPVRILRPDECPPPLTWTERKAELLANLGIDWMVAYPTDEALLRLTAAKFFQRIVCDSLAAKGIVEGPNFYFGHNREGDIRRLAMLAESAEISLDIVEPLELSGGLVSSSRIRNLVSTGDVGTARKLLSAPYRIRGLVTHGAGRGQKIGFPTANLSGIDTLLPAYGVYAGRTIYEGKNWPVAINFGMAPTFGEKTAKMEVHLIGMEGNLYGLTLEIDFLERLRDIRSYERVEEIQEQLRLDVEQVRRLTNEA